MDPEACLSAAERAVATVDVTTVVARLSDLCEWLASGGFAPKNLDVRLANLNDALAEALAR